MEVRIRNSIWKGPEVALAPGDELAFGRGQGGIGRIEDAVARYVSRHHGTVRVTDDGFTVSAMGTQVGVIVRDRSSPSELHLPNGSGPIQVPFRSCSLIVDETRPVARLDLDVAGSASADRWHECWGAELTELGPTVVNAGLTFDPFPAELFYRDAARTKHYSWWVTLVALCEPLFGIGPAGVPTNRQLSSRLNYSPKTIEHHLAKIFEALRVDADLRQREIAAHLAFRRRIVTATDVAALP